MGAKRRRRLTDAAIHLAESISSGTVVLPHPNNLAEDVGFASRRLARVRSQIERVSDMIDKQVDPSKIERLTRAACALQDLEERITHPVAGRHTTRPTKSGRRERSRSPIVDE